MSRLLQFSKCFKVPKKWWKCCLSIKQLGSGWEAELLGVSSGSRLFAYDTLVVIGGLGNNNVISSNRARKLKYRFPRGHAKGFFTKQVINIADTTIKMIIIWCLFNVMRNVCIISYSFTDPQNLLFKIVSHLRTKL